MNRRESNGKRIICAVDMSRYYEGKWVDYYVSDERIRKYSEICKEWKCLVDDDKEKFVELGSQLEEAVKPISEIKKKEVKGCYIVFNRYLYHIGGLIYYGNNNKKYKTSKNVYKVDLNSMDSGWVKVDADMNCARYNPYPVILEGELYVLGGIVNNIEDNVEKSVLMEVFKNDGSGWKMIPNPPSSICIYPQLTPFSAGVLKSKSLKKKDVIIVAIEYPGIFELYTYESGAGEWMAYGKISTNEKWLRSIEFSIRKPGVVSEQLMLYLGDTYKYCLCIMDLESFKLDTIDLIKAEVIPRRDVPKLEIPGQSFLVMIEEGKFCLFYTVYGPITHEQNYYFMLKACIFTLEKKKEPTKRKRSSSSSSSYYYYFDINIESRFLSHILDLTIGRVQGVCLVD